MGSISAHRRWYYDSHGADEDGHSDDHIDGDDVDGNDGADNGGDCNGGTSNDSDGDDGVGNNGYSLIWVWVFIQIINAQAKFLNLYFIINLTTLSKNVGDHSSDSVYICWEMPK